MANLMPTDKTKEGGQIFEIRFMDEIYSQVVRARLAVNAKVATVLGSIPASSDTVESEGWQMNNVE